MDQLTVVFISNDERKVPIWTQKACVDDNPVVWDYHVILLFSNDSNLVVYDFDTILPFPCIAEEYVRKAFKPQLVLRKEYERYFRLIPAKNYLHGFASDRSHMKGPDGQYLSNPPNYDPIISKDQVTMNLDEYISMKDNPSIDKFEMQQAPRNQKISEAKLNKLLEQNTLLKQQLDVPRIPVSEASASLIEFCNQNVDPLIPSVWGHALNEEDAFSTAKSNRRCIIM
ncbi:hypothetical protein G6F43_003753 [Rhizopus delemar]|nr:hypothetical protein G6F43_003753 [Rhizopus delemar]